MQCYEFSVFHVFAVLAGYLSAVASSVLDMAHVWLESGPVLIVIVPKQDRTICAQSVRLECLIICLTSVFLLSTD